MRVFDHSGAMVAESPSRDPEVKAQEVLAYLRAPEDPAPGNALTIDASNLAPISLELEAVRRYAKSGSLAAVSRELGIAIYELQKLQRTQWWQLELAALRRESMALKNAMLEKLHDQTLAQLQDRLEHGDYITTATGRFVRQKLSGKDLARISEAVFKQRQILNGEPTEIRENKRLETLAEKLRALGKRDPIAAARIIEAEAIDVTALESHAHAVVGGEGTEPAADSDVQRADLVETSSGDA
jgi:hypothetical protein